MLQVNEVKKTFGSIVALDDVSFQVKEGEFIYLTGPSGSGKTTLLRLILRDLLPDTGEILIGDENIVAMSKKNVPKLRQQIGVVFQDFKVLPERTARENVEVALAVVGTPAKEWRERVNHVLRLVELLDRSELFPSQLSGGELQRVSLARALVVNPKLVLADEPTGNLDWATAESLMRLFEKINEEGKTILMATHHRGIMDQFPKREIKLEKAISQKTSGKEVKKTKKSKKIEKSEREQKDIKQKSENDDMVDND